LESHLNINIVWFQIKVIHVTRIVNPTTMLVDPIGLKVVLPILHMSNSSFDSEYFIVDVGKFITNTVLKDLLIQVEMVH
jgi:hypothetical protein